MATATITFEIVNGYWSDGTDTPKTRELTVGQQIGTDYPSAAGSTPKPGWWNGVSDWEPDPYSYVVEGPATIRYVYSVPLVPVTYEIVNGYWPDGTDAPKIRQEPLGYRIRSYPSTAGSTPKPGWTGDGIWNPSGLPSHYTVEGPMTFTYSYTTPLITITYEIVNGTWSDGTDAPISKEYSEGSRIQNEPRSMKPKPGWGGTGSWSPRDPYYTQATAAMTYTYSYTTPIITVTYEIVNGTWSDGTDTPISKEYSEGSQIRNEPRSMTPKTGYRNGAWEPYDPYYTLATGDVTQFVYRYVGIPRTVTYHIADGTWADGTTTPKTETVVNGDSPVEVPTGMIPSDGFSENGSWSPHNPNGYVVDGNIDFTYTFEAIPIKDWAVLLRIVNGMWDDGSITSKQYTVVDGQTIPAVPTGMMPFEGFGNGYWSSDPSAPIREDRTFVYTFRRIAPSDEVHFFTLGDVDSINLGMYIGGQHTYNAPKRDVTKISVPGRNGDLIQDNGRFLNVQVPYNVVVMEQFRERTDELKAWLLSTSKYRKLVDTYHPGTYRLARVGEDIVFNTSAFNLTGKTQVIFDCKPQRFLDEGDEVVEISAGSNTIVNPTLFDSEPILKVYVSGGDVNATLRINNAEMELRNIDGYIVIDSEIKECYKDGQSRNSHVVLANYKFPTLKPGINSFEFSSGITKIEVTPKWWTI